MEDGERAKREQTALEIITLLSEEPFEVEGAPMVTVKYDRDAGVSFKKKTIFGGWGFFLNYAYVGKRGEVIFGFAPVDPQEWDMIEISLTDVDEIFPLIGGKLAEVFSLKGEKFHVLFEQIHHDRVARIEKEQAEAYKNNPIFGAF